MHRPEASTRESANGSTASNSRKPRRDLAKNAEAITAVRELLFGEDMGAVEGRMDDIHNELLRELGSVRAELAAFKTAQAESLKKAVTTEREARKEQLATVKKELSEDVRSLKKSTDSSLRNLTESRVTHNAMAEVLEAAAANLRPSSK